MTATERDRLIIVEQKIDNMGEKIDRFLKCQDDHEARIRALEQQPSKRWNTAITAIVSAIIGAAISALFAIFTKR